MWLEDFQTVCTPYSFARLHISSLRADLSSLGFLDISFPVFDQIHLSMTIQVFKYIFSSIQNKALVFLYQNIKSSLR